MHYPASRREWLRTVAHTTAGALALRGLSGCTPTAPGSNDDSSSPPDDDNGSSPSSARSLFNACLESGSKAQPVQRDVNSGQTLRVVGTPTFFFNGQPLVGNPPLAAFEALLIGGLPSILGPLFEVANDDHFKGDLLAPNTIVEYGDFECPVCGAFFRDNLRDVTAFLVDSGRAVYVFRHFPLRSIHPRAQAAAEAAECAADQRAFWPYHDLLFENQPNLDDADLRTYADQLRLG